MTDSAATVMLREGDSLEYDGEEAVLTLRLNSSAAAWFASSLPPNDEMAKLFWHIHERLTALEDEAEDA